MPDRTFRVVSRFFVSNEGWKTEVVRVSGDLYTAGKEASKQAHHLDELFGDTQAWRVDLYHDVDNVEDGLGSYYQLFHGRLR